MKRFSSIMVIILISLFFPIQPSSALAGCGVRSQTNRLFKAIKAKNFETWSSLCAEIQEDLSQIRRTYPRYDRSKIETEYRKPQYKGFIDSYNTVYLVGSPGNIDINYLRQRVMDNIPDDIGQGVYGALVGVPMLIEKYNASWKLLGISKPNTAYVELFIPNKGSIGIVEIKWNKNCLVNAGKGYLIPDAINFYKINNNWPIIPNDQLK
jgi:hypothetical protein